jgi:hypothetical protein
MARKMPSVTCIGLVDDWLYYKAGAFLEAVAAEKEELTIDLRAMIEPEWDDYCSSTLASLGGSAHSHAGSPLICVVR